MAVVRLCVCYGCGGVCGTAVDCGGVRCTLRWHRVCCVLHGNVTHSTLPVWLMLFAFFGCLFLFFPCFFFSPSRPLFPVLPRWFLRWVHATATARRHKRIIRESRARRYLRLQRVAFRAWHPYTRRLAGVKRMIRRHLTGVTQSAFEAWVADVALRHRAAAHIAAVWKGHRYRRRCAAATQVQRIVRGRLGRLRAAQAKRDYYYDAAMALQSITRGFLDRLRVRVCVCVCECVCVWRVRVCVAELVLLFCFVCVGLCCFVLF